jgi:hypothetical protein
VPGSWPERTARSAALSRRYLPQVRPRAACQPLIVLSLLLATAAPGQAQGLPEYAPANPVSVSRSALYFQPYRAPAPGRWTAQMALDYASIVEYNRLATADYVLDSEVLRLGLELGRDLGSRTFVTLNASVGGAYAGFLDGFLDWYHHALGIKMQERERRPEDQFLYTLTLPSGVALQGAANDLFLNDLRLGFGLRYNPAFQSLFTLTLPTATGPAGYGRGVVAVGLLNTWLAHLDTRLVYEGSLGGGFTPSHGTLQENQRELFLTASSGLRFRIFGAQSVYANLFYHSPYYHDTTLPALDLRDLSLDFGWIMSRGGKDEWRLGLTEDLEPAGPGVDLVVRLGRQF